MVPEVWQGRNFCRGLSIARHVRSTLDKYRVEGCGEVGKHPLPLQRRLRTTQIPPYLPSPEPTVVTNSETDSRRRTPW